MIFIPVESINDGSTETFCSAKISGAIITGEYIKLRNRQESIVIIKEWYDKMFTLSFWFNSRYKISSNVNS